MQRPAPRPAPAASRRRTRAAAGPLRPSRAARPSPLRREVAPAGRASMGRARTGCVARRSRLRRRLGTHDPDQGRDEDQPRGRREQHRRSSVGPSEPEPSLCARAALDRDEQGQRERRAAGRTQPPATSEPGELVAYACPPCSSYSRRIPAGTLARGSVRDLRAAYECVGVAFIVEAWTPPPGRGSTSRDRSSRRRRGDAARPALAPRRGPDPRARREGRGAQPGRVDQGPRGARADRGGGARRPPQARRHDHRADQRQHRHRPRHGGIAEGLSSDRGDARQDVQGEDRPAARVRRRGGRRAHRGAARLPRVVLPRGRPADRRDPRRVPAEPVPQPRQPGGRTTSPPAPSCGASRAARSPIWWPASAPGARSPASGATCASRTPRS